MDHEVSLTNQEIDNGQHYLQYSVLNAKRDSENLKPAKDLPLGWGDRPRAHEKMRDKVSQKGLSAILVVQTGHAIRIQWRGRAFWAKGCQKRPHKEEDLKVEYNFDKWKKGRESGKSMNKTVAAEESRAYLRDGHSRPHWWCRKTMGSE